MASSLTSLHLPAKPPSFPPHLHLSRPSFFSAAYSSFSVNLHRLSHICLATPDSSQPAPPVASEAEIDMFPGRDGVFSARLPTVVILWDLDNKPPQGPPFEAAAALKRTSALLGEVRDFSAYANRHAFAHVPEWVRSERNDRRKLDYLEKKGLVTPDEAYSCGMCGRKFKTRPELKRHFKQLHERERTKKVNRMRSLKGKKKDKFRERYINGNEKYENSARELLTPKSGYGLASELRRAGVNVRTVQDKPQAADIALKKRVRESLSRGVDWMVLISDDSDFIETIRMAREAELRTVVIGEGKRALGREADIWLPWGNVENGDVTEGVLKSAMEGAEFVRDEDDEDEDEDEDDEDGFFTSTLVFGDDEDDVFMGDDFDDVFEEIMGGKPKGRGGRGKGKGKGKGRRRGSVEEIGFEMEIDEVALSSMFGSFAIGGDMSWDSDDDDDDDFDDDDEVDIWSF